MQTGSGTGLRTGELHSLTVARLDLTADRPFVIYKARQTKSEKACTHYIKSETARELREFVSTESPASPVFRMPKVTKVAAMLQADLADARSGWIAEAKHDPDEYERRTKDDFLSYENHEGLKLDFHSLRYTTGAWLAKASVHPKKVQRLMRHSTITLTMDTYGHLFPGEEAETVDSLPNVTVVEPKELEATGTDSVPVFPPEGGTLVVLVGA